MFIGCKGGGGVSVTVSAGFLMVESRRWLPKLDNEICGLIGEGSDDVSGGASVGVTDF